MNVLLILISYFVLINIVGFTVMGIDKRKARKRAFRIPEATLFVLAVVGGSIGTTLAMFAFRHKTKHWYFLYGMPAILLIQLALFGFLFYYAPIEFSIM